MSLTKEMEEHLPKFSYFSNIYNTVCKKVINVVDLIKLLKSSGMKSLIEDYRKDFDKNKKKGFPTTTPSGEFTKRNKKSIIRHSGLICLDIDNVKNLLENLKKKLKKLPFVHLMFESPSFGLKVFIKIDAKDEKEHLEYFKALEYFFKIQLDIEIDPACKDITRGCYLSYDEDPYYNEQSETLKKSFVKKYFPIEKNKKIKKGIKKIESIDAKKVLENAVKKFMKLPKGKKYHALYKLAVHLGYYINSKVLTYDECYYAMSNAIDKRFEKEELTDKNVAYGQLKRGLLYGIENPKPVNDIKVSKTDYQFWFAHNGLISINITSYHKFLNRNGFWCYIYDKVRVIVRIQNNIVSIVEKAEVIDFIMDYIRKQPFDLGNRCNRHQLESRFRDSMSYLNGRDQLFALNKLNKTFQKDTKGCFYINYKNGVLKVTKEKYELIPYEKAKGLIWETSIVDRTFNPTSKQTLEYTEKSDFVHFMKGATGEKTDKFFSRYESMKSIIGYLLHEYKDKSKTIAVIFCDEDTSDNPNGGTGKGIIIKALEHLKKIVILDGKNFKFSKSFAFQQVDLDTKLLVFEDVKMLFNFEQLFSVITEGITVEKKNKQSFFIPFEDSSKILITTNYMISGEGSSHRRRKVEIEFSDYYNEDHTPLDEFGRMLYEDWDDDQWQYFDLFMVECMQMYLQHGIIKPAIKNIPYRKLRQQTNEEFVVFTRNQFSESNYGKEFNRQTLREEFFKQFPQFKDAKWLTQSKFNKWLRIYAECLGLNISERVSDNKPLVVFSKKLGL
jgi:hypothetical protein